MLKAMFKTKKNLALSLTCAALLAGVSLLPHSAQAVSTRVVATVNDNAISEYQVKQRMKLLKAMGERPRSGATMKKTALDSLIDEVLKREEAKRVGAEFTIEQVDEVIQSSPGLQSLSERLRSRGMSPRLVKQFIITRMTWNRIVSGRFGEVSVDDNQIDAKHKQIVSQINREIKEASVDVYRLMPIDLPIAKQANEQLTQEVVRSRMIEAQRIAQRFKGCGSARKAASGVFNVNIGNVIEADPRKMPKQTLSSLKKLGVGNAAVMGVSPGLEQVQMIAFCGTKRVAPTPPKISREDVRARLENDRYRTLGKSYIRDLRRRAFIEYKDASYKK
ncbi:MAG: SurA N-terminal domain-containing protein [Hyphomicrobiales bacterium]